MRKFNYYNLSQNIKTSHESKLSEPAWLQGQGSQTGWFRKPGAHLSQWRPPKPGLHLFMNHCFIYLLILLCLIIFQRGLSIFVGFFHRPAIPGPQPVPGVGLVPDALAAPRADRVTVTGSARVPPIVGHVGGPVEIGHALFAIDPCRVVLWM